jgi:plastocyanin
MQMTSIRRLLGAALVASAAALAAAACGSSSSSSSSSPSSPSSPATTPSGAVSATTITIAGSVVSPKNVIVARGSQVTFVNSDNQSHNMTSDPHPDHTDCPEINQVGFLSAGQQRQTGNMVTNRTVCGFHDHDLPNVAGLQGSITIQ